MAITQTITAIPSAGQRGVQERDAFVTSQEAFQDALTDTTVGELNTLATQMNSESTTIGGYATSASAAQTAAEAAQTAAETAQTAAETAQTNAETAQTAAETAYDDFDDRWLGAKSSAPTLDNDGNALQDGALYYNNVGKAIFVYDLATTTWIDPGFNPTTLVALTDTNIVTPTEGQALTYDNATGKWINTDVAGGTLYTFDLGDAAVQILTGATAQDITVISPTNSPFFRSSNGTDWEQTSEINEAITGDLHIKGMNGFAAPNLVENFGAVSNATSLGFDGLGNPIWGDSSGNVKKLDGYTTLNLQTDALGAGQIKGILDDGTDLHVLHNNTTLDEITMYKYTGYDLTSTPTTTQGFTSYINNATMSGTSMLGIRPRPEAAEGRYSLRFGNNGTYVYLVNSAKDFVEQYSMSVAYDLTTAKFYNSCAIESEVATPLSVTLNATGTKMFVTDATNVYEYALSTAWEVQTKSLTTTKSIVTNVANAIAVHFNSDGTKMFVLDSTNNDISEYTISVGYDLTSTVTYVDAYSFATETTVETDFIFNSTGTKFFIVGGAVVYEYSCTAFDISTSSYSTYSQTLTEETTIYGIDFNSDGTKLCVWGGTIDGFSEYSLLTGYDLNSTFANVSSQNLNVVNSTNILFEFTSPTSPVVLNRYQLPEIASLLNGITLNDTSPEICVNGNTGELIINSVQEQLVFSDKTMATLKMHIRLEDFYQSKAATTVAIGYDTVTQDVFFVTDDFLGESGIYIFPMNRKTNVLVYGA